MLSRAHVAMSVGLLALAAILLLILSPSPSPEPIPPIDYVPPRGYLCGRTSTAPIIDGQLDDPVWRDSPWSENFVDIEGDSKPKPLFRTRVKMVWDDKALYIAAELDEPHVWANSTLHDSYIFQFDNDFEVFLDPDGDSHVYAELEMNALNTTWDLLLTKPYKNHGLAIDAWEIDGLKTAVRVNGTLNDPRDTDRGWTIEIAWPWKGLGQIAPRTSPPQDGDQWRINFSRVEWQPDIVDGKTRPKPGTREDNWVWSPQGVVNMHQPETWGYLQFSSDPPGVGVYRPDRDAGIARHWLHKIYRAQHDYRRARGRFARSLRELRLNAPVQIEATSTHFEARLKLKRSGERERQWQIRDDARIVETTGRVEPAE
jgi:hypothetical protein